MPGWLGGREMWGMVDEWVFEMGEMNGLGQGYNL